MSEQEQGLTYDPPAVMLETRRSLVVTEGFSSSQSQALVETASTAMAAAAKARIEAGYIMALRRPRDWDDVRARFLKECRRPSFAKEALYAFRRGGKDIEGPGIRVAEAAIRSMTNTDTDIAVVYDDGLKRIVRVAVLDFETNNRESRDVPFEKTVERGKPEDDGSFLSVRKNSNGRNVYTVHASEDDIRTKQERLAAMAKRNCVLKGVFPQDFIEEGVALIKETAANALAEDPDGARKKIADGFGRLNVAPSDLKEYLGHPLESCSPAQLKDLQGLWVALRDGEVSWREVMEERAKLSGEGEAGDRAAKVKDLVRKAAKGAEPKQEGAAKVTGWEVGAGLPPEEVGPLKSTGREKGDREPGAEG